MGKKLKSHALLKHFQSCCSPRQKSVSRAIARLRDGAEHPSVRLSVWAAGYTFAGIAMANAAWFLDAVWGFFPFAYASAQNDKGQAAWWQ